MITLTLKTPPVIPLELDGILPERLAAFSDLEIAKLPLPHGNRSEPLGEFFGVSRLKQLPGVDLRIAGDTRTVKRIAEGMASGSVFVEGHVGMHAGARMKGGRLVLDGSAGDWLGAEMTGGSIEVRGNAGGQVGAAYRGSRRGMSGGTIVLRGSAGDELGLLQRRGLIVVEGSCGEFAGASMIAGTIVLLGEVGSRLGAGMKRGTILSRSTPSLTPAFRYACRYRPSFLPVLAAHLRTLGADISPHSVQCYRGDLLAGGRGEILVMDWAGD